MPWRICFVGVLASLLLLCCMVATLAASSVQETTHVLTSEERSWLSAHPDITLGYTDAFEPEVIVNPDGSHSGMLVDFLDALNERIGTQIKLHIDTVPGILAKATSKEVDGILEMHPAYADKLGLLPTKGYLTAYPAIFGRRDIPFESPSDFAGKKVAIVDKVFFSNQMIRQYGKQASVLKVKDTMEGLRLVNEGDADLFLGVSFNSYLITKYQLFGLVAKYTFFDSPATFGMAVRADWPELISILNKGIASFAQHDIDAIVAKWIHHSPTTATFAFTPQERVWIAQEHRVRVRLGNYPPNAFVENGKPAGIAIDLLREVSKWTGVTFDFAHSPQTFGEALNGVTRHSGPDLLPSIQSTPEREKQILFTDAYLSHPKFIFTRDDAPFISSMTDLYGKTVAVERNFVVAKLLERRYPDINLKRVDDSEAALAAVSGGQAFAYVGPIRPVAVQINRYGFTNLKAAAPSSLPDNVVRMGVRNDWPELRSIVNRVLASIPDEEKIAIINKWTPVKFEHGIQASDLVKWALGITGGVLIIVGAVLLWNRSLAGRVLQRTRELESTAENLEAEMAEKVRVEAALQESRSFTDKLIEMANVMIVGLDSEGNVNVFNPAAEKITGYTLSELQEKNWFELLTPKDRYPQVHAEFSRLMAGGLPRLFENPILTKNGDERVISWCNNEIENGDQVTGILSFGIDITDKKKAEGALVESELRFRSLMEQSPFSIQLFTPNGILIQVNEAWQALWGIPDESLPELLGSYNVLEDEEARKMGLLPLIQKAFNGENVVLPFVEYDSGVTLKTMEIDGPGGKQSVVQSRFYPVKNQNGDIVTVVSIEEDITQRMKDQEALRKSEEMFRSLIEQSSFSTVINNPDGTINRVNNAFLELWNINEEELPELLEKYCILEDEEVKKLGLMPLVEKAFHGEPVVLPTIEYDTSRTKENLGLENTESEKQWVQVSFFPIKDSGGEVVNVVALEEDITQRKKAEEKIQQYQQRLKALAAQLTIAEEQERRRIAADLHDRVGHSLALACIQLNSIPEAKSDLEKNILVKDVSHILIEALQDTRNLISELSSPTMHKIGLGAAVSEWLEEQITKRHGMETELIDTISDARQKILGENTRALLFRNVRELLINVVKHARAKKVRVYLAEDAEKLKIAIEDDGIGFDPDEKNKKIGKPEGFGLFSIQERMTDLGGTFDIQSAPGKGCQVTLTVPLEKGKD